MSYLSTAELTDMRNQAAQMLPDSAILYSMSYASDGEGGGTPTYTAVSGGTVACRVDPLGKNERIAVIGGQESTMVAYQLTVPYDAPLAENIRVVISSKNYEVIQLDVDHSWNVSRRAIIKEIR